MAKSKKKLEVVHLVCEETGDYNYTIRRKSGGEKLKLKKYSPRLRKHTVHVERKSKLSLAVGLNDPEIDTISVCQPFRLANFFCWRSGLGSELDFE